MSTLFLFAIKCKYLKQDYESRLGDCKMNPTQLLWIAQKRSGLNLIGLERQSNIWMAMKDWDLFSDPIWSSLRPAIRHLNHTLILVLQQLFVNKSGTPPLLPPRALVTDIDDGTHRGCRRFSFKWASRVSAPEEALCTAEQYVWLMRLWFRPGQHGLVGWMLLLLWSY